jgi:hypothetical protein
MTLRPRMEICAIVSNAKYSVRYSLNCQTHVCMSANIHHESHSLNVFMVCQQEFRLTGGQQCEAWRTGWPFTRNCREMTFPG